MVSVRMDSPPATPTLAYAGLMLATVGWAAAFIIGKVVLAAMPPLPVAVWRYAVAAAMLLPFALRQRPRAAIGPAAGPLALMVLCGGVLYPWLFLSALARTSATNTALLVTLNPALTVLLAPLVGEPLSSGRLGGVGLALAGAVMVITRGQIRTLAGLSSLNPGDLLAVAGAATWAAFNLASRSVVARLAPSFTNWVVYTIGAVLLYGLDHADGPWAQLAGATPAAVSGIVAMAALSSVMAGQFFLIGVRTVGVSQAVVFVHLVPLLTAALAALLLDERFGAAQAVGGAAVLIGVYRANRAR